MRTIGWVALLVLVGASSGAGQGRPQTREGFWIGFGFGGGSAEIDCDGCSVADELKGAGPTFHLRMGGTVSPKLLFGGEVATWTKEESGVTSVAGHLAAAAYFYPSAPGGFFLKGGLASTVYAADDGVDELTSTGFGLTLGAGYDIRIGQKLSLTPMVNLSFGGGGELKANDLAVADGFKQGIFEVALGLTFH